MSVHVATRWALDHVANGVPLEQLVKPELEWREGWEYVIPSHGPRSTVAG